jgi:hypothetical protein
MDSYTSRCYSFDDGSRSGLILSLKHYLHPFNSRQRVRLAGGRRGTSQLVAPLHFDREAQPRHRQFLVGRKGSRTTGLVIQGPEPTPEVWTSPLTALLPKRII